MIRQLRPPNVFFTKSVNESGMLHLIKALKEKDEKRIINDYEVKEMSKSERIKIIKKYLIDVVHHLDTLFCHNICEMKNNMLLGEYHIKDFFNQVRFQQRGSAHIHSLLWLITVQDFLPHKTYLEESEDESAREWANYRIFEYLKVMTNMNNAEKLCVTDLNIPIIGKRSMLSVK